MGSEWEELAKKARYIVTMYHNMAYSVVDMILQDSCTTVMQSIYREAM